MAVFDRFRSTTDGDPVPAPVPARPVRAASAIIDGPDLTARLAALVSEHGPEGGRLRPAMLALLQQALTDGRGEIPTSSTS